MKLYIDLDDTVKDTSRYINKVIDSNKVSLGRVNSLYSIVADDFFIKESLCNWDVIPFCQGALNSLKLLETEHEIVFCSQYLFAEEAKRKQEFASSLGKSLYLFPRTQGVDKDSLDMSDGVLIDDNLDVLLKSNAQYLYEMLSGNKRLDLKRERPDNCLVTNWFHIVDVLLSDRRKYEDTRRIIYQGV